MGCFFGCFRVKDSNSNLITPSGRVTSRSKNALSSLFVCDDDQSVRKGEEGRNELPPERDDRELENEAKFLKASTTLPETPVEIRKTLDKWEDKSAQTGEENCSRISSSMEELKLEKQFDESPAPVEICEEWATGSASLVDSPSSHSCLTDGLNSGGVSSVQCVHKSLRFDCDSNKSGFSSSECVSQNSNQYPRESIKKINDEDNLMMSTPMMKLEVKSHSVGEDVKNEESLSSWFKPISSAKKEANNKGFGENVHRGRTPGDRPILGMVAAHWNEDETSRISPKWWDGNGIPNSTNKYKEDQKVSWHATPFEERLEKALSEETFISQRKRINGTPPLELDETDEESDTALSHMQPSSAHIKSVVSY